MNLEQIVKETVAKIVAEKQGKDLTGDGKIDSADYLKARSNAIEKAKNLDEDYEVAMAQDSLDSIIRSVMMLKAQMGDNEVNLPAWIQDHITNAESYIYQAAKGYHESDAQIVNKAGAEEINEEYDFIRSAIESASGDKLKIGNDIDDYDRPVYFSDTDEYISYFIGMGGEFEGKIYKYNAETGERYPIGDLKHYGDGQNHAADDDMYESQDISDDELAQLQATADDTSKMPAERDAARNKIYASRAKKESQELEEFMIRRWQYYAGIK
jgi:hypothetical protein